MKIFESDKAMNTVFNFAFAVFFFMPFLATYGVSVYADRQTKELVEFADSVHSAEEEMKSAEAEMFFQAMDLYEKLDMAGGKRYLTLSTQAILLGTDDHLPNLEYYKAAIKDMQDAIDPDGDRFDDCDYKMAWKAASKAEAEYERLSERLDSMTYVK